MLGFLAYNPVDALGAMELPHGEFLLVFNTLGVYVDVQGRKSRDREIMYPAVPTVGHRALRQLLLFVLTKDTFAKTLKIRLMHQSGRVVLRREAARVRRHSRGRVRRGRGRLGADRQHPPDEAAGRQDRPAEPQHAARDAARYVPEQHPQRWVALRIARGDPSGQTLAFVDNDFTTSTVCPILFGQLHM